MSRRSSFLFKSNRVLVVVAGLALLGLARPVHAVRILMVGGNADPTFGGDVGTYAILAAEYGEAAELGDDGVFYMSGGASSPQDADLVDVVFISSTLGSGTVRDKFEDVRAGVLNHEEALMHDNQTGNFFMVNSSSKPVDSQLTLVEPDHPLAAGLEDIVDVFEFPETMSTGSAPSPADLAPDAIVIAEVTSDPNLKGIYAIEEGGQLLGDGSPGRPDVAAGRRVMFFLEDQGGNSLTPDGEALLLAAVDWLAEGGPDCEPTVRRITRTVESSPHQPGQTITVTLDVMGVSGPATIEETFPDHLAVADAGGGVVDQNRITFNVTADASLVYTLQSPDGECATSIARFAGGAVDGKGVCETRIGGDAELRCVVPRTGEIPRILMLGRNDTPTFGGDGGTYALLIAEYGEAAAIGDEGVFYMNGSTSSPEDAELVDVVFISSTLDSGAVRDKFEDATAGVLNHEQALMHDNNVGNFFMVNGAMVHNGDSQLTIVDPDHPLAAGLEDVVDVYTSPQRMSVGSAFSDLDLAPDAFVIAEVTSDATLQGIFAIEEGGQLLGDGSPGRPAEAPGPRVMFFLEDQGGNFLTADGEALLIAAIDWLAEGPDCERTVERITRTIEPSPYEPGQTISVTLNVTGVSGPTTIEETFPDHLAVVDAGGGVVDQNRIMFNATADGDLVYTLQSPDGECAVSISGFAGSTVGDGACETRIRGDTQLRCVVPRTGEIPRILMLGADAGPTFGGDAGTYAILTAEYGEAAEPGDEGVFYMIGSSSVPEDAELVDVVFISSTLGSGTVRDKFEDARAGVLDHEQALMDSNEVGDFFMVTAAGLPTDSQLTIVDPDHPLAAGLEDVVDVYTSPQVMSAGSAFSEIDLAPDAFVIAEVTSDSTFKGIYAIEEGGELLGDDSPGSPSEALGRRVMFFLEDQGGNFLTADGEALLIAAIDWLSDLEVVEPGGPEFIRGDADGNGTMNVTDGIFLLNFLFSAEGVDPPCMDAGDVDDSGGINLTDAVFVLNFLFGGEGVAADPPAPYPDCGEDPTTEVPDLGCETPPEGCTGG